jgi:16S rRNA (guanine1207-N2)-methyltransferase
MLHSELLRDTLHLSPGKRLLVLNSALDPFLHDASLAGAHITLAEDNIAAVEAAEKLLHRPLQHFAFHDYILHSPDATMDVAILNLLYQPSNAWMFYALQLAYYALRPNGKLYVVGAKDRGVLSVAKRMQERFGNLQTLETHKGSRVVSCQKRATLLTETDLTTLRTPLQVFADSKLDPGTDLLLASIEVRDADIALDIGCGAGFIGLELARRTTHGHVTMLDASLAAVAASQEALTRSGLQNVRILPSDAAQAVLNERFDLVATNPPFHQGGLQTLDLATRFIRQSSSILRPSGRFYLVANRFLKYEPILLTYFRQVSEVGGNTRYKVLCALEAVSGG